MKAVPSGASTVEIYPGILWFRLPLPFRLNHVNVYAFEDEDGWTILDTGVSNDETRAVWEQILAGPLAHRPIARVIISHFHLDHVGLAGWFSKRSSPVLLMAETEYFLARLFQSAEWRDGVAGRVSFLRHHGVDETAAVQLMQHRLVFRKLRTLMPESFQRLRNGDHIRLARREWRVITGGGHASEQIMLHAETDRIFISSDQILPRISPNISVSSLQPNANPLGDFLQSLAHVKAIVTDDHVTLPGHGAPFDYLHTRIDELVEHHISRCELILETCRTSALTATELLPVLFKREIEPEMTDSALGEAVAHINYLRAEGRLTLHASKDGILSFRTR